MKTWSRLTSIDSVGLSWEDKKDIAFKVFRNAALNIFNKQFNDFKEVDESKIDRNALNEYNYSAALENFTLNLHFSHSSTQIILSISKYGYQKIISVNDSDNSFLTFFNAEEVSILDRFKDWLKN